MTGGLMVQTAAVAAAVVVDIPVGDITELQGCRTCRTPGVDGATLTYRGLTVSHA
jgi:hypothetical protein